MSSLSRIADTEDKMTNFKDKHGNPVRQGFYEEVSDCMPQRGLYYFDHKKTMKVRKMVGAIHVRQEEEVWVAYEDGRDGLKERLIDNTEDFFRVKDEEVRKRISSLRKRADFLEGKLK